MESQLDIDLRIVTQRDWQEYLCSGQDSELNELDPSVGECRNPVYYSIYVGGKLIGICSLYNQTHSTIEHGIRIWDKEYWGKGYGTLVVSSICSLVFSGLNALAIIVKTPALNARALRCYEKCGFTRHLEGVFWGQHLIFLAKSREGVNNHELLSSMWPTSHV